MQHCGTRVGRSCKTPPCSRSVSEYARRCATTFSGGVQPGAIASAYAQVGAQATFRASAVLRYCGHLPLTTTLGGGAQHKSLGNCKCTSRRGIAMHLHCAARMQCRAAGNCNCSEHIASEHACARSASYGARVRRPRSPSALQCALHATQQPLALQLPLPVLAAVTHRMHLPCQL